MGALAGALLLLGACDSTEVDPLGLDPFDGRGGALAVYGYLDARVLDQRVRVQLLRRDIARPRTPEEAAVGADVYTEALGSGRRVDWVPRTVRYADSTYGVVYEASFAPEAGETYRLTVERGADKATAEATVPLPPSGVVRPIETVDGVPRQAVEWAPPPRVAAVQTILRISCGLGGIPYRSSVPFQVDSAATAVALTAEGGRVALDYAAARAIIEAALGVERALTLYIDEVAQAVTVPDAAWPLPADTSSLAAWAQPGASSNVENGYGRFGAVNGGLLIWEPEAEPLGALNFRTCSDEGAGGAVLTLPDTSR